MQMTAAKSATRISQSGGWLPSPTGHASILERLHIDQVASDYTPPHLDFEIPFGWRIPTREEWNTNEPIKNSAIHVYTDGSKMELGTGAGIFSEALNMHCSIRIPDYGSVFQAEVLAVKEAARMISMLEIPPADITILIDSQAAIKAISAIEIKSKLVACCREELKVLSTQHSITLCWVPGHRDIIGNETADELARKGAETDPSQATLCIEPPLADVKKKVEDTIIEKADNRWNSLTTCETTRMLWPKLNSARTDKLLQFNKKLLPMVVGALTGHNHLRYHRMKMRLTNDFICRGCGDPEEREDTPHYLCHCPSLCQLRQRTLGEYFFQDLHELTDIPLNSLSRFIGISGWLDIAGTNTR